MATIISLCHGWEFLPCFCNQILLIDLKKKYCLSLHRNLSYQSCQPVGEELDNVWANGLKPSVLRHFKFTFKASSFFAMCLCFKHWILNYYKEDILKLKSDSVRTLQLQVKGSGAKWTYSLIPHILHKDKTSSLQRLVLKGLINGWMGVFHLGKIEAIRWNLKFTHFLSNISQIQFIVFQFVS